MFILLFITVAIYLMIKSKFKYMLIILVVIIYFYESSYMKSYSEKQGKLLSSITFGL